MTSTTQAIELLTEEQQQYLVGLRELADFLEQHPTLIPVSGEAFIATAPYDERGERARFADMVRELGTGSKSTTGGYFYVDRMFGPHTLSVAAPRAAVCERVVVGTETVKVPDPDAVAALPKVTQEREVVEWRCPDSILRGES